MSYSVIRRTALRQIVTRNRSNSPSFMGGQRMNPSMRRREQSP